MRTARSRRPRPRPRRPEEVANFDDDQVEKVANRAEFQTGLTVSLEALVKGEWGSTQERKDHMATITTILVNIGAEEALVACALAVAWHRRFPLIELRICGTELDKYRSHVHVALLGRYW